MNNISGRLQIFFDAPFWVGVFERIVEGKLSVCKVTFRAEPKDYEALELILKHYEELRFSPAVVFEEKYRRRNPKHLRREVKKQIEHMGVGTKSQQALKLQHEQCKQERKNRSRKQLEAGKQFQFELKQQKRKEKHRGR